MQARINPLLEALWADIKQALNDDRDGIDLTKLDGFLKTHSRLILSELGKSNIPALSPTMMEKLLKYLLPQGIDPLISSVLSYLRTERDQDSIYLDPLNAVRQATEKLRTFLEKIAQAGLAVEDLAWHQFKAYQEATRDWREVLIRVRANVIRKLQRNQFYQVLRHEQEQPLPLANGELVNWRSYSTGLLARLAKLTKLREEFSATPGKLPDSFFSTSLETWRQLMNLSPEEDSYWTGLWNKREPISPPSSFYVPDLGPTLERGKYLLATTLYLTGIQKGSWYLKTDRDVVIAAIDQRCAEYQEAMDGCQTLAAISQAETVIISRETVLDAQLKQLNQLEAYLTTLMSSFQKYAQNSSQLDGGVVSLFLRFKAWLGFSKAIEERDSSLNLSFTKAGSWGRVMSSTLNILECVKATKGRQPQQWDDKEFNALRTSINRLHLAAREETARLTQTFDAHNNQFRREWYFWRRETVLTSLFNAISEACPSRPSRARGRFTFLSADQKESL